MRFFQNRMTGEIRSELEMPRGWYLAGVAWAPIDEIDALDCIENPPCSPPTGPHRTARIREGVWGQGTTVVALSPSRRPE